MPFNLNEKFLFSARFQNSFLSLIIQMSLILFLHKMKLISSNSLKKEVPEVIEDGKSHQHK